MANSQFLRYDIYLPDKDLVDTLNAEVSAGGGPNINAYAAERGLGTSVIVMNPFGPDNAYFYMDPLNAAQVAAFTAFNGGVQLGAELPEAPVISTVPAILVSSWFTSDSNFPWNQRTFETCTGGWFGICALFGDNTTFYWGARFVYRPYVVDEDEGTDPDDGTVIPEPAPIPQRRWVDAFSMLTVGANPSAGGVNARWTRAASIWPGHNSGFAITREGAADYRSHTLTENTGGGASTVKLSWERLYFRVQNRPASEMQLWETNHTPSAGEGCEVRMLPSGQLAVYTVSSISTTTLVGSTTVALPEGEPILLDLLYSITAGTLRIYYKHALIGTFTVNGNWGGTPSHAASKIRHSPTNDNDFWIEWMFWMNADIPNKAGTESLDSADFLRGSRPVLLKATGFAADHGAWDGGFGISMQNFDPDEIGPDAESDSTTAEDIYSVTADAGSLYPIGSLGPVAMNIGLYSHRGTNTGELGFKINAEADDYGAPATPQIAGSTKSWVNRLVDLTAAGTRVNPRADIAAIEVKHKKGNDTGASSLSALLAVVEVIGVFDEADVSDAADTEPPPPLPFPVHNSPFPTSPWGYRSGTEPLFSPYGHFAGTYVGTGAEFELEFPLPICFLMIRRATGASDPITYWSSAHLCSHEGIEVGTRPDLVKAVRVDPDFPPAAAEDDQELQCIARISAGDEVNQSGQTFQYFAIADPGGRFHLLEAIVGRVSMNDKTHALQRAGFQALAGMLFGEAIGITSTSLAFMVGGNITAGAVVPMIGGAEIADALVLGAGSLTVKNASGLWSANPDQYAAMLVRQDDGNGPFATPPVKVVGWTGDGGASRTITLDMGGRRPLMAWAAGGATGDGYFRDPSMTGANSMDPDGGSHQANGITGGGLDSISVGSDLNANGINYVMIVWPGSATAGNGGFSVNGDFYPVEPDSVGDIGTPTEGGGTPAPSPPSDEPDLDNSTPLPGVSDFCVDYTLKVVNMGLTRIGHSNLIADLISESSREAVIARAHIKHEVETTLRDHAWSFATAYAALSLLSGTETSPVNEDWTYLYAAPSDYVEGRRVIDPTADTKRRFTRTPEPWRMSSDATNGRTVYANVENAEFEYTRRVTCPAFFGDQHFIDALAWRMAKVFAGPIARDTRLQDYCEKKYQEALAIAASHNRREAMRDPSLREHDASWIEERDGFPRGLRNRDDE